MARRNNTENVIEKYTLYIVTIYLVFLACNFYLNNAWENRADFFEGGKYSPAIFGMLINEVFLAYLMAKIIFIKFEKKYFLIFLLCSIVYYSRAPLILLSIVLLVTNKIKNSTKVFLIILLIFLSVLILYLRFGNLLDLMRQVPEFYGGYPLVGIGRLLVTELNSEATFLNFLSIIFRPLEIVFFPADYFFNLEGHLSAARFAGNELNKFVYVEILNSSYNAFGTILFPYFLILGPALGALVFCMWAIFYFLALAAWTKDTKSTLLYMLMLGVSGLLFSWCSPFIWMAPFLFGRKKTKTLH
jgi:hypothetical protein